MAQITKKGRTLGIKILEQCPEEMPHETWGEVKEAASLIARHAKTLRHYEEVMCGNGVVSGEWVNAHWDRLETRYDKISQRIAAIVDTLPMSNHGKIHAQIGGDPRGWVVRLLIPTGRTRRDETMIYDEIGVE